MTNQETTTVFVGIDGRTATELPAWYADQHTDNEPKPFTEAIRALPRAVETTVAYNNPYTDEWLPTERFNALVDPERLHEQARGEERDALFHVPIDSYSIINPVDVYGPLEDILREASIEDSALGDIVFGAIRQYRGGGEVHMDILFDGLSVDLPSRREPITMGLTSGYDFFGGHSVYVEGFAQDTHYANSMRRLTDRKTVKHVGDIGDFESWWGAILDQLGLVADDLLGFIEDAGEITVDFTTVPFDLAEFYELLDFPGYLAERAASDARAEASDPFDIDMWTLHSGATYALTHFFRGKEGPSLDRYVRRANDILFNPEATITLVEDAYERQASADTDGNDQTGLDSQVALAQVEQIGEDVRAKARQFEQREVRLRERFVEAGD
jgi:hypothetical protein